jgi:ribosome-binding protein aMBF1 (putative translation factor)
LARRIEGDIKAVMLPEEVFSSRARLGWSQTRLAAEAKLRREIVEQLELGEPTPPEAILAIQKAFAQAGLSPLSNA